jgi:hypothetical protein
MAAIPNPIDSQKMKLANMLVEESPVEAQLQLGKRIKQLEQDNQQLVRRIEASRRVIARLKLERRFLFEKWQQERESRGQPSLPLEALQEMVAEAPPDDIPLSHAHVNPSSGARFSSLSPSAQNFPPTVAMVSNRPISTTTNITTAPSTSAAPQSKRRPTPILSAQLPNAAQQSPHQAGATLGGITSPQLGQQGGAAMRAPNNHGGPPHLSFNDFCIAERLKLVSDFPSMEPKEMDLVLSARYKQYLTDQGRS